MLAFGPTVTSNGQHDIPPVGTGFLSLGFSGALPPEWWGQSSIFAIGPDWLCSSALFWIEEVWIGPGFASAGSAQPMKQANTAIHREITVAIADLKVWNGKYMTFRLYPSIPRNNPKLGYRTLGSRGQISQISFTYFMDFRFPFLPRKKARNLYERKGRRRLSGVGLETIWRKKEEAGQVVPPPHVPFRGCLASLTEGG